LSEAYGRCQEIRICNSVALSIRMSPGQKVNTGGSLSEMRIHNNIVKLEDKHLYIFFIRPNTSKFLQIFCAHQTKKIDIRSLFNEYLIPFWSFSFASVLSFFFRFLLIYLISYLFLGTEGFILVSIVLLVFI